jgi:solute carrier family 25 carnitine/acylcarnitine transporter 20/29
MTELQTGWSEVIATLQDLTAGTIGGCAGIIAGQPLDTVKVRMQTQDKANIIFRSPVDCFVKTAKLEGPRALFKGMTSPLVGNAPMQALTFGAYGNMRRILEGVFPIPERQLKVREPPPYFHLCSAGCWAGLAQCVIASPVELVKCKLQIQRDATIAGVTPRYTGPWDCLRQSIRSNGLLSGMFRGWWPTFWRDCPSYGIYFGVFEFLKHHLTPKDLDAKPSMSVLLFAGAVTGVMTWASTYPFDVCKSIVQTLPEGTPKEQVRMSYVFSTNYRKHGYRFFLEGLGVTLVRAIPANAVTLMVYEYTLNYLKGL